MKGVTSWDEGLPIKTEFHGQKYTWYACIEQWIEYILYIPIWNMFILHVEDPRQSMHVHYNLQKEQHFFIDTNKLPPIQCITESTGNIDSSNKFTSVSQNLVFL